MNRREVTDRALAVCEAALEWMVARVCQPKDYSRTMKCTLKRGELIVAEREREAQDADASEIA